MAAKTNEQYEHVEDQLQASHGPHILPLDSTTADCSYLEKWTGSSSSDIEEMSVGNGDWVGLGSLSGVVVVLVGS